MNNHEQQSSREVPYHERYFDYLENDEIESVLKTLKLCYISNREHKLTYLSDNTAINDIWGRFTIKMEKVLELFIMTAYRRDLISWEEENQYHDMVRSIL